MSLGVCCAAALSVFAPVSPAAAAYAPTLLVTPTDGTADAPVARISLRAAATDAATARVVLYLPVGWAPGRPAPGAAIGRATATALAPDGSTVTLAGTVIGATADDAQAACALPGSAVWLLQLARSGTLIQIPLVVAAPPTQAAGFAAATITACWPAASSAAAGGLRLLGIDFGLGGTSLRAPRAPGTYRWRALFTPYAAGAASESPAGTVEAQSLVRLPARLTLAAKLAVRRTPVDLKVTRTIGGRQVTALERQILVTRFADLSGFAREFDGGIADAAVDVLGGVAPTSLRRLTQVTPAASGLFTTRIQIDTAAGHVTFRVRTSVGERDLGAAACTPSFGTSVACVSATAPAVKLESAAVTIATGR